MMPTSSLVSQNENALGPPLTIRDEDESEVDASGVSLRKLADPRRNESVDKANADSSYDSGTDEHVRVL